MLDFSQRFMTRFASRVCGCWEKSSCFDLWSHFAICKCFKVANPMQVVQYTWNMFHDKNKYTNRYIHLGICHYTHMIAIVDNYFGQPV